MFLRSNSKPDPKQQALDNVLMMLVHKKMTAPAHGTKRMTPSYPPARDGGKNYEPAFNPKPVSRRGGASNPDIMSALKTYMDGSQGVGLGQFNPDVKLDPSQVQDMRGLDSSNGTPMEWNKIPQQNGPYMAGPLSRTKGKPFGDKGSALNEDGGFHPQGLEAIMKLLLRRGAFAGNGFLQRPGPVFRNGE